MDEDGRRVTQPGKEGELWVRGGCVALGYWGEPEKTAAGFIRTADHGPVVETLYRTGDIVQLAEDGKNWLFVGRRDHMIKSRGYRIELGEIEAVLYAIEGVKEAAVVAVPDDLVGNRLMAFVVPTPGIELQTPALKTHCGARLPSYMVPEHFEQLETLPKTSTGKVDRTLLAERAQ
jgi:L-proline---[L-prolyl-carrier protein] ligase